MKKKLAFEFAQFAPLSLFSYLCALDSHKCIFLHYIIYMITEVLKYPHPCVEVYLIAWLAGRFRQRDPMVPVPVHSYE